MKCRVCAKSPPEVEFKKDNICVRCNQEYMREYRKKNRAKISAQVQAWKVKNHVHYREQQNEYHNNGGGATKHKARYEKAPRVFLAKQLGAIKSHSDKPGPHHPKSGPRRDFDIDIDYIMGLWEKQNGICAITKLKMVHRHQSLQAVSIDRIDSSKGHIVGNIQLVCIAMNWAKRNYHNSDIMSLLDAYYELRRTKEKE